MSELKSRLQSDLTQAMREKDEVTLGTVRMALTAITNAEVSGKQARELTDDEVIGVLATEAKKRREAATSYDEAGASERAEQERAELLVITRYLPSQLSDDELRQIVASAVETVAAEGKTGPSAMGAVMKLVQPQVKGRVDGSLVATLVKQLLAQ
ncbi:MAG: GatB/YqeY domain-containing protein [Candidatus Nanopelagicales bacterium]